mmetsp:Transcript_14763/g.52587  ORF Transcript_14763/g.52587 Transcript_14763/m.52587 type:complete len:228 (-) Transcript_14763:744-1427(-)
MPWCSGFECDSPTITMFALRSRATRWTTGGRYVCAAGSYNRSSKAPESRPHLYDSSAATAAPAAHGAATAAADVSGLCGSVDAASAKTRHPPRDHLRRRRQRRLDENRRPRQKPREEGPRRRAGARRRRARSRRFDTGGRSRAGRRPRGRRRCRANARRASPPRRIEGQGPAVRVDAEKRALVAQVGGAHGRAREPRRRVCPARVAAAKSPAYRREPRHPDQHGAEE